MQKNSESQPQFFSGTSGLVLPVRNKSFLPPEFQSKTRLRYYSTIFNSIEINSTFYKLPLARTIAKWAGEVPDTFRFTFKLWREITHIKNLSFQPEDVVRFIEIINQVGDKKGCLLVQFPPSLKIGMASQLEKLCTVISEANAANAWKIALEFRHNSWYHEDIYDLLNEFGFGVVIHDKPGSVTPFGSSDVDFTYLRFHGPNGDYKGHYDAAFTEDYSQMIREWLHEGLTVYTYFNNTMGDAVSDLRQLNLSLRR
ncbi:DUF72 domain-containing protein [Dyadobacter pollutisoli]|uniref:DUF72 domain-containing protein n=1 Tax=Dyadobacter pollutisoli TaxID=2910158 RepID=A0A9E8SNL0_9BACT|nr:DUF72 domain-containing protein [Dyadobacter pollutisoli]WAC15378.1 DUF72 domain-containing protein [Dyadobacter pollutisoli]